MIRDRINYVQQYLSFCGLTPSSKPIGWIGVREFRRKYNSNGSIQTFNIRLVAKSYTQKEGIDYFNIYHICSCDKNKIY